MRIAFIVDQFPTLSETFILNQITGLIDRGHEVDIYCDRPGNILKMHPEVEKYQLLQCTHYTPIPTIVIWRFLKGIVLALINFWKAPQIIIESFKFLKYDCVRYGEFAEFLKPLYLVIPFLNQLPYDIIHCHYGRNGLKGILLKDLGVTDGKIAVAFHGNDISRYLLVHGEDIYSYLFKRADLFLPISYLWKKKLIALGCHPDKVAVHHMGIDCHKFMPAAYQDNHRGQILIVSIARLVEKKGLFYGIQAVAQLLEKHPQLQYFIIGDGVLKPELEKQIKQLKVSEQIKLLGWREQQEVQAITAQADIVLAPSVTSCKGDREGIPVSLMEAMAQEIPVISTYHSGIPELVEDGISGYLVKEKEAASLAIKLENLITQPELRQQMGEAGRSKIINDHNIELLCDRLMQIYDQLASQ